MRPARCARSGHACIAARSAQLADTLHPPPRFAALARRPPCLRLAAAAPTRNAVPGLSHAGLWLACGVPPAAPPPPPASELSATTATIASSIKTVKRDVAFTFSNTDSACARAVRCCCRARSVASRMKA